MPYIKDYKRNNVMSSLCPETPGELNYALTMLCQYYLENEGYNYTGYNAAIGALESAKLEMYRRQVASYEDEKMKENGDVYLF